jgi:PAS domain S-box-containing protein
MSQTLSPQAYAPSFQISDPLRRKVADLVLKHAAEGIWLIDAQARTTFVNRRAADLLGYSEAEMIGMPVFAFMDPALRPLTELRLAQRALGVEEREEVELVRKDGTRIWVLGSATPIFDDNGEYAGALAVLGDLTPQKRREALLRAQLDDLRRRFTRSQASSPADLQPTYREPFRTAVVLGMCGTFVATVAVVTAGVVLSSLIGVNPIPGQPDV